MDKKTALHQKHIELGAKMTPFAGWDMPLQYSSILDEHKAVRNNAGIFDVSHMGQVFISGADALNFLQKIVPQDVSTFKLNRAHYCQLTGLEGGIIDDLIVYKLVDKYLIIVNASRRDIDVNWMKENAKYFDVNVYDASDIYSMIALQGPNAYKILEKASIKEDKLPLFFEIINTKLSGVDVLLSRTGYTGEDGFEIITENESASEIWQSLFDAGREYGLKPIGLGARDTLRLEAALCLFGADIDENITPIEADLAWSVPKDKKEDYNGKSIIMAERLGTMPLRKKLFAFEMTDRVIARHGADVYINGKKCGVVTSGSISPALGKNIGFCLISFEGENAHLATSLNTREKSIGTNIEIMVRNKLYNAKIVKKPFVEKKYVK